MCADQPPRRPDQTGWLPQLDRAVELVIFDCDGVLIDSEVIGTRMTVEALAAVDYRISDIAAAKRFVGRSYRSIQALVEAELGRPLPPSFMVELERRTLAALERELRPMPGATVALTKLQQARCVASSSSITWIQRCLEVTGLLAYVAPHLFSASMVEHGKPAPDLFHHAAQQLGVAPDRCVVVEDSTAGVRAGVAAGMTVIGFTGGSHVTEPAAHGAQLRALGATILLDDLARLPALLAGSPDCDQRR